MDDPGTGAVPATLPDRPGFYQGQPLATWGQRALALILDWAFGMLLLVPGLIVLGIGAAINHHHGERGGVVAAGGLLLAAGALVQLWQMGWRQGRRGRSWGKQVFGLETVSSRTLRPLGGWVGVGRLLVEALIDSTAVLMILNYLWPLGDRRRQTWHDKIVSSVVLSRPATGA